VPIQAWLTLVLLILLLALLVWDKLPAWLVFSGALTAAMTLGLANPSELLRGLSNAGMLTVAALFPVATGMYSTGAISLLSQKLFGRPKTETSANFRALAPVKVGSAFVNDTPVVAMLIPVVRDLMRGRGLKARSLYRGLSFASIVGGRATLIGSSINLVVAGMVADAKSVGKLLDMKPIEIFDQSWVGIPAALAGLLHLIYVAPPILRGMKLDAPTTPSQDLILQGGDRLTFASSAEDLCGLWTTIGLAPARGLAMS
jgi:di/tricarboxylate transporter